MTYADINAWLIEVLFIVEKHGVGLRNWQRFMLFAAELDDIENGDS